MGEYRHTIQNINNVANNESYNGGVTNLIPCDYVLLVMMIVIREPKKKHTTIQ